MVWSNLVVLCYLKRITVIKSTHYTVVAHVLSARLIHFYTIIIESTVDCFCGVKVVKGVIVPSLKGEPV